MERYILLRVRIADQLCVCPTVSLCETGPSGHPVKTGRNVVAFLHAVKNPAKDFGGLIFRQFLTASKIMWIKNNEPQNYIRGAKILLPKDYITYKLTGVYAAEVSDASGMQLIDVPNRCWSDVVLENLEIDKALLGKVYESVEIMNPNCRGVFFGLSAIHTRAHLTRAIMEGVGFSLLDCLNILKDMTGDISLMKACGSGGKSVLWRQMLADMYNCNVSTVENKEGPALGVAILAGVGAGIYSSVETACHKIIRNRDTIAQIAQIAENHSNYNKLYEIYKVLYKNLELSFDKLETL